VRQSAVYGSQYDSPGGVIISRLNYYYYYCNSAFYPAPTWTFMFTIGLPKGGGLAQLATSLVASTKLIDAEPG